MPGINHEIIEHHIRLHPNIKAKQQKFERINQWSS